MKKILIALCLLFPMVGMADLSGLYFGGNIGQSYNNFKDLQDTYHTNNLDVASYEWVGSVNLGYQFNPYVGLELSGLINPKQIFVKYDADNHSYGIKFNQEIATGTINISIPIKSLVVTAKGGISEIFNMALDITRDNEPYKFDNNMYDDKAIWTAGGRIGYKITDHFMADIDYTHYFKQNEFTGLNYLGIGIEYFM
jgi:hypothetical protein